MSTAASPGRRTLQDQLDRMDKILDGLAEALEGAVAMAVGDAVQTAVKEAVYTAIAEFAKNPQLLSAPTVNGTMTPEQPAVLAQEPPKPEASTAETPAENAIPWLVAIRTGVQPALETVRQLGVRGRALWRSVRSGATWAWTHRTQLLLLVISLWAASAVCI